MRRAPAVDRVHGDRVLVPHSLPALAMKAAVRHSYGGPEVIGLEEVPTPVPGDDELLVRVHAVSVNLGDWELLTGKPPFISVLANLFGPKPRYEVVSPGGAVTGKGLLRAPKFKILGSDVAGRVEAVGRKVTRFRPGDEIFGMEGFGGFAEYLCISEKAAFVAKPPGVSFEQAAAIPQAGFIALQAMRDKARVEPGQTVLINGAGGGAGTFAVQLARRYGAEVTGVDGPAKLEMLRSLGADHVIDYTREDFAHNGQRYDVILDLAAYRTVFESRRSLTAGGIYLMAGGSGTATWQSALLGPVISRTGGGRVAFLLAKDSGDDLEHLAGLIEAGEIVPVIDRCYPLGETAEALRRVGEKQSLGKVIINP